MQRILLASLSSSILCWVCLAANTTELSQDNIRFVEYPDFPEAHSTWGSIGFSSRHNKVFIGVTNHKDRIGLYEYDVPSKDIELKGFIDDLVHLRAFQWQGKIHSQIVEGPDGAMYFSTDGGESREEYLMNHPHGYHGGLFLRWDPATGKLTNLGMALRFESIKDIAVDRVSGLIYGVSYPQVHFLVYNPADNDLKDMGRMGSDHVPRILFSDRWGNGYYVDWRQRLVKYERSQGKLTFAKDSLPAFPGTPGNYIITGITASAENHRKGKVYLITYGAKLVAFYPQEIGIGPVEDLGGLVPGESEEPWGPYCPNVGLGANDRLYYFLGGHGSYVEPDTTVLMEYDPETKSRSVVMRFSLDEISEVTGNNVRDREGNLYFCGRRRDIRAQQMGESGQSRPFLIVFHPERSVR
jgi:hypothetical protein